ncbi:MAG UNVERIFIED_CONTAM: hypothetical protein LVR18_43940 [Planctomycetaceae bacterium]
MFGWHDVQDASDNAMEPPLCWITNEFDRSPGELLRVDSERWGPFNGSLLNLSYGTGKVFLVPYEQRGTRVQGEWCNCRCLRFQPESCEAAFTRPTDSFTCAACSPGPAVRRIPAVCIA